MVEDITFYETFKFPKFFQKNAEVPLDTLLEQVDDERKSYLRELFTFIDDIGILELEIAKKNTEKVIRNGPLIDVSGKEIINNDLNFIIKTSADDVLEGRIQVKRSISDRVFFFGHPSSNDEGDQHLKKIIVDAFSKKSASEVFKSDEKLTAYQTSLIENTQRMCEKYKSCCQKNIQLQFFEPYEANPVTI